MSNRDVIQIIVGVLIGSAFWVYGYLEHKKKQACSLIYHQVFKAPRWLFRLSGEPTNDSQLEVGGVIFQVMGFLLPTVSCAMVVLGVEFHARAIVITLVLPIITITTSVCARLLLSLARR
jgi:hypothetical protein